MLLYLSAVRFRPTAAIWFIVLAPFLTFLVLAGGWLWGLYILFASHLLLVSITFVPSLQGFGPVLTKYFTTAKTAWLTIDDGPDPETTPQVLALLEKYRARATFFLIGAKAANHPELTRMIVEAGHTIGNHTQTHPKFSFWRLGPRSSSAGNRRIRSDHLRAWDGRSNLVSCPGRVEESVFASDCEPPAAFN